MGVGYFRSVFPFIAGNSKLRIPQIEAYLRIKDHFDAGETAPALAILPTGTGKTGLMALIPFGVAERRVLVITPSLVIRDGIMSSLNPENLSNFWRSRDVIRSYKNMPYVVEFDPALPLEVLDRAHIVVANIHKTQLVRANSLLGRVPRDYFDMIIVDEAHHSAAQSWVDVERYFGEAKVVKLTGTPWRTDNQEIFARVVYEYELGRAMTDGYVKRLINRTWLPQELTFTIVDNGVPRTLSYDEAAEIKETDWLSRQIAYSPECNQLVVDKSLEMMHKQRTMTGNAHKIIAVAMTIAHAHSIKELYHAAGASAAVISSDMDEGEKRAIITDFDNDRTQVLVNVNMLGEGFDHPLISVAAVFRPFRSLLPYVQFAGRALRVIQGGTVVDNTAHLVYHKALNLESLWEYFKQEERRADVIQQLQDAERRWQEEHEATSRSSEPQVLVQQGGPISEFADSFSDDIDFAAEYRRVLEEIERGTQAAIDALANAGVSITDEVIDFMKSVQENETVSRKRPDLEFIEGKKRLPELIKSGVADILVRYGVDSKAPPKEVVLPMFRNQYNYLETQGATKTLDGFLVALINLQLRQLIGRVRSTWNPADFIRAESALPEYLRNLEGLFEGRN